MGARAILQEIRDLLKTQVEAVVAGEHQQVLAGATRHEELLGLLEHAEMDASPDELRALAAEIDVHKVKLQSLLTAETARTDYLLRLLIGGGPAKPGGYPTAAWRQQGSPSRLNRRT